MRSRLICFGALAVAISLIWVASAFAAIPPSVYVSAWNSQRVDEYAVGSTGALTKVTSDAAIAQEPWYMVMPANLHNLYTHAHRDFLYSIALSGKALNAFSVATNGKLAPLGTQLSAGAGPEGIALSPDDKNAYVADYYGGAIYIYDISPNGTIKAHSPASISEGIYPDGVAVSANGKSVYLAESGSNDIRQFNRGANGSLTPKTPATVPAPQAGWIALTPDGRHLYVANYNDSTIGVYNVAPNGALTQQPGSSPSTGDCIYEMAIRPNGKNLYAADNCDGNVYQYAIKANGSLTPLSPSTQSGGSSLDGIWLSPNGRRGYVANEGTYHGNFNTGYDIAQFKIGSSGLLSPMSPPTVAADDYPAGIAITPDQSPTAAFTVSGRTHIKKFTATGSKDPDGRIALYKWRYGDGGGRLSTSPAASHFYKHKGTYTVTLTVTDNASCSAPIVWTGQMAYCNGNPGATVRHKVKVS
jgi:DNA-binding beta-propeller fold protein YncE